MTLLLITGAGGYVGSKVAIDALDRGYDVRLLDDFSKSQVKSVGGVAIDKGDIRKEATLKTASKGVDCILHLAAISGVSAAMDNPNLAMAVNSGGTHQIAALCRQAGTPMVFASTLAVLGWPSKSPIEEDDPCHPLNAYGESKLLAEKAVKDLAYSSFSAIGFRMSNVYGIHRVNDRTVTKGSVVNRFLQQVLDNSALEVYEPGTQSRDFVDISDVGEAFLRATEVLLDGSRPGLRLLNLASGRSTPIEALAKLILSRARESGRKPPGFLIVPNPRRGQEILGERFDVSIRKLGQVLRFQPSRTLDEYVKQFFI